MQPKPITATYNQRTLEELVDAGTGVTLFVWEDTDVWPVRYVSNNVETVLGYNKTDFLERQIDYYSLIHEDDLARVQQEVELLKSGVTDYRLTHKDYRVRHKHGHYLWVTDTTVVRKDEQSGNNLFFGYIIDITSRKELELQLETERNRLSLLLDATRLGTWEWNPQTGETTFNERWANMFGYYLEEIDDHVETWSSRLHPDDYDQAWNAVKDHLDGITPFYESQHRILHRNGNWVYVLDRGRIIERDERGRATRFAGTVTDVTEQKQSELDARRAAHAKNVFLANMSHEIRTPLHGILGLASVLESTDVDAEQLTLLETIKNSGDYLLNTLNDLLDLTQAEEGQLRIKLAKHTITEMFEHIHSLFARRSEEKGLTLSISIADNIPDAVVTDKARVVQVVSNLVNNAIKFTDSGYVRVVVEWHPEAQDSGELRVDVEDSGTGIRDTQRIWQLFEQEDDGLSKSQQGSGLGLAIVRNLVQLLNGTIQVDSVPGEGSRFTVCLPMKVHRGGATIDGAVDTQALPPLESLSILVVDDNGINQLIVKQMLLSLGQKVTTCNSGQQAIEWLDEASFDAIFMDLHMPGMDGMETTRRIREKTGEQPYIIALTANAFPETRTQALRTGMNDYVTKPFVKADLARVLSRLKFSR